MALGKLACGIWLLPRPSASNWAALKGHTVRSQAAQKTSQKQSSQRRGRTRNIQGADAPDFAGDNHELSSLPESKSSTPNSPALSGDATASTSIANEKPHPPRKPNTTAKRIPIVPKPRSLYPSAMLGSATIARGEIGFLISSLAESHGIFASSSPTSSSDLSSSTTRQPSEIYLIVTWAIMLCTILGPVSLDYSPKGSRD